MAKETPTRARKDGPSEAEKLIDLLAASGTGKEKLDIARGVLKDVEDDKEPTAEDVITHLKRSNVDDKLTSTIEKAQAFVDQGLDKAVVARAEPAFDPRATAPGTVPVVAHPRADVK